MGKYIGYSKSFCEKILTTTLLTALFKCRSKMEKKEKKPLPFVICQAQRLSLQSLGNARENNILY